MHYYLRKELKMSLTLQQQESILNLSEDLIARYDRPYRRYNFNRDPDANYKSWAWAQYV